MRIDALFAARMAEDFGTILTVIKTSAHLISDSGELGASTSVDLDDIREAVNRGVALSRELLAVSRTGALEVKFMSMDDVLDELTPVLLRLVGHDLESLQHVGDEGSADTL